MYAVIDMNECELVYHAKDKETADKLAAQQTYYIALRNEPDFYIDILTPLEIKVVYQKIGSIGSVNMSKVEEVAAALVKIVQYKPFYNEMQPELFEEEEDEPEETVEKPKREAGERAPRQSGIREVIWQEADRMWSEAGKPTEKSDILKLRKQIMDYLEKSYDIKRTSSSNELGNWQKNRI